MRTFPSLRKQIRTPAFIGFASSALFHLGLIVGIFGVFDRRENLQETGLAQITMSLASINTNANQKAYSTPTKPRQKRQQENQKEQQKQRKSKHPIPLEEQQQKQDQVSEQDNFSKDMPTELESNAASNQDSQGSTYESLAFNEGISDEFYQKIQIEIRKKHRYPRLAQIREMQGSVWVDFVLEPNGEIKNLKIYRSNTGDILNTQALKSVIEAHKNFPKPTKVVRLKIEINYNLAQR